MINSFRRLLIRIGKILPFVLCFIVCISYTESLYGNIIVYGDISFIETPISFFVAEYFEYDLLSLAVMLTISVAIETCYWNKLAIIYLCINLYERSYFATTEISEEAALLFAILNIITSGFLAFKGIYLLIHNKKDYETRQT
jgi:hypothetical protein